jgi:pyrimidine operon attenuation protein/uracil phosphoribosyltransferase
VSTQTDIDLDRSLDKMAERLSAMLADRGITAPLIIGIHTGGVWVAEHLHRRLGLTQPLGTLNISFYRDDFSRIGIHPRVEPSNLPFGVDDRHIVLVDDVLYTGRTIRAALNEIFDYGRPASVLLAVLVERGGRELPIQADVTGIRMDLGPDEHVKLNGPETLSLTVQTDART